MAGTTIKRSKTVLNSIKVSLEVTTQINIVREKQLPIKKQIKQNKKIQITIKKNKTKQETLHVVIIAIICSTVASLKLYIT